MTAEARVRWAIACAAFGGDPKPLTAAFERYVGVARGDHPDIARMRRYGELARALPLLGELEALLGKRVLASARKQAETEWGMLVNTIGREVELPRRGPIGDAAVRQPMLDVLERLRAYEPERGKRMTWSAIGELLASGACSTLAPSDRTFLRERGADRIAADLVQWSKRPISGAGFGQPAPFARNSTTKRGQGE